MKKKDTDESRAFWAPAERTSKEVATWPDWKQVWGGGVRREVVGVTGRRYGKTWALAQRSLARLARHRETYVRAFCARHHITPEQLDSWELVQQQHPSVDGVITTSFYMRPRSHNVR